MTRIGFFGWNVLLYANLDAKPFIFRWFKRRALKNWAFSANQVRLHDFDRHVLICPHVFRLKPRILRVCDSDEMCSRQICSKTNLGRVLNFREGAFFSWWVADFWQRTEPTVIYVFRRCIRNADACSYKRFQEHERLNECVAISEILHHVDAGFTAHVCISIVHRQRTHRQRFRCCFELNVIIHRCVRPPTNVWSLIVRVHEVPFARI